VSGRRRRTNPRAPAVLLPRCRRGLRLPLLLQHARPWRFGVAQTFAASAAPTSARWCSC